MLMTINTMNIVILTTITAILVMTAQLRSRALCGTLCGTQWGAFVYVGCLCVCGVPLSTRRPAVTTAPLPAARRAWDLFELRSP